MIHGSESAYSSHGCRCDECRHARFVAVKRRLARRRTGDVLVDATKANEHLSALEAEGFGRAAMLRLAGWCGNGRDISDNQIHRKLRDAIMALTRDRLLAELPGGALVPAVGAIRRIRALRALGWPHYAITPGSLIAVHVGRTRHVTARIHRVVAARFEELCMTPGPSLRSVGASDGVTPLMWDDIDDPQAVPSGRRHAGGWSAVDPDDITLLLDSGYSVDGIADRLGVQYESLYKQLRRLGRDDVKDRLIAARRAS